MVQVRKPDTSTDLALMRKDMDIMTKDIAEIKTNLSGRYVTQDQYWPVKTLVYGATAVMLLAIISALVLLVVPRGQI